MSFAGAKLSIAVGGTMSFYLGTKTSLAVSRAIFDYSLGLVDISLMLGVSTELSLWHTEEVDTMQKDVVLSYKTWALSKTCFAGPTTRIVGMLSRT